MIISYTLLQDLDSRAKNIIVELVIGFINNVM